MRSTISPTSALSMHFLHQLIVLLIVTSAKPTDRWRRDPWPPTSIWTDKSEIEIHLQLGVYIHEICAFIEVSPSPFIYVYGRLDFKL